MMKKPNKKIYKHWDYKSTYDEAQKYKSRGDFKKGNPSAYTSARKHKWLDDYYWFIQKHKQKGYWNYESCYNEAKKHNSLSEFHKCSPCAYRKALKSGWLNEYDWFVRPTVYNKLWTYDTTYEEAKKYNSRNEFANGSYGAYQVACVNKWLDDYFWFIESKTGKKWVYKTCYNEAKKYNTRTEFQKYSKGAYVVALKNKWIDEYTWMKDKRFDLFNDKVDSVYVYEFNEFKCAYVGRTLVNRQQQREWEHIFKIDKDAVAKFAKEHNISVPKPIYLEENLTLREGTKQEGYWLNKYIEDGWTMLNSAKTGSIGALGKGKWNFETCYIEAKKYNTRTEFERNNGSAYNVARKNNWIDYYYWMPPQIKPNGYWNYETCRLASNKCVNRSEFRKLFPRAEKVSRKNNWIDHFFPKTKKEDY